MKKEKINGFEHEYTDDEIQTSEKISVKHLVHLMD